MFFNLFKSLEQMIPASDCLLCCETVSNKYDHSRLICHECHSRLPLVTQSCPICAMPSVNQQVCGACLNHSPYFDHCLAAFHYEPPISNFIARFKFNQQLQLIELLSQYLYKKICAHYDDKNLKLPNLLIPVPLHSKRIRQRGFNQAQLIGKYLAKKLQRPLSNKICQRIIDTQPQSALNANQRQANLRGAFSIHKNHLEKLRNQEVAIIDDVVTTGSTVNELSKQLIKVGVRKIHIWCLARAINDK